MKIAYIFGSLNHGGIETLYLDLFKNKDSIPYDFICIHRKKGTLLKEYYKTGIDIRPLPCKHFLSIGYIFRLRKFLAKNNIDIVHTQMAEDTIMVKLATIGRKIDTVQTVHAFDFGLPWYAKRYLQWTFKHNKKTLFVTNFQHKHYQEYYKLPKDKTMTLHNCISFSKIEGPLQKELPRHYDGYRFGMVGNFCSARNHLAVCKALLKFAQYNKEFDFYFVGRKEEDEPEVYNNCVQFCMDNGLGSNVHFLGMRPDVPGILKQLDCFVYSTIHDTFAISVLEAMATGIPTIVNDWPVLSEITDSGRFATLFRSNDSDDLCIKLLEFVEHMEERKTMAKNQVEDIRKKYGIEHYLNSLNDVYVS